MKINDHLMHICSTSLRPRSSRIGKQYGMHAWRHAALLQTTLAMAGFIALGIDVTLNFESDSNRAPNMHSKISAFQKVAPSK